MGKHQTTTLDIARDNLFGYIQACDVLRASSDQQDAWLRDTIDYLGEQFPELTQQELGQLYRMGGRYCRPVIPHGKANTALTA